MLKEHFPRCLLKIIMAFHESLYKSSVEWQKHKEVSHKNTIYNKLEWTYLSSISLLWWKVYIIISRRHIFHSMKNKNLLCLSLCFKSLLSALIFVLLKYFHIMVLNIEGMNRYILRHTQKDTIWHKINITDWPFLTVMKKYYYLE